MISGFDLSAPDYQADCSLTARHGFWLMAMQGMLTQDEISNYDTIIASVPASLDGKVFALLLGFSTINLLTVQACLCISAISTFHNICMHDFCLRQPKYGIIQLN